MIVADTNVVSELMRREPDVRVAEWWSQHAPDLYLTSMTASELLFGAERMPPSRRKTDLEATITSILATAETAGRILPFDTEAARHAAHLRAVRERKGRTVGPEDTIIAAVCLAHGYRLATRNTRHFDDLELDLIDPWAA